MPLNPRQKLIIRILDSHQENRISGIKNRLHQEVSIPTLNRDLKELVGQGILIKSGQGKTTAYRVAPAYRLLNEDTGDSYFDKDTDQREGNKRFDPEIFSLLKNTRIFNGAEQHYLEDLHITYRKKIATNHSYALKSRCY